MATVALDARWKGGCGGGMGKRSGGRGRAWHGVADGASGEVRRRLTRRQRPAEGENVLLMIFNPERKSGRYKSTPLTGISSRDSGMARKKAGAGGRFD
uniref:Uncharacterized protein n=2 Tax=Oryza sativa subsp. japonica TaxID=39947 RepID=Q69VP2_ORYSJ|nr:hypothetical protein [Oryza sativa Japonica Group]BAD31542.1 hypothetical protein [Oryza sativa Japonica Group]